MLVLWSGGCDSTLLLLRCLKEGLDVRTLAINHDQVISGPYEKEARKKLRKRLRKRGFTFPHQEITIKTGQRGVELGEGGLTQPNLWLAAGIGHLQAAEDLAVGYIRHDDIWHYIEWYKEAYTSLLRITGKSGSLLFPLEWLTKEEVVNELRKEHLIRDTWYCEMPKKGRRCGWCESCVKMKNV